MRPLPQLEDGRGAAREEWFRRQRAYPSGEIDGNARRAAFEEIASRTAAAADAAARWQSIGPAPTESAYPNNWGRTSGRIRAVAISPADPNLILLGSSSGGIWRSSDGGASFIPVSDDQADLSVASIAFAPSNPAIIYAAMGSDFLGSGVLKSFDAGRTWRRVSSGALAARGSRPRIVVHASNPNVVYLAQPGLQAENGTVYSSGFHVSTDGGVTWRVTLMGLVSDIAVDPLNPAALLVAVSRVDDPAGGAPGIYRSTDGGATWRLSFTGPFDAAQSPKFRLAISRATPAVVYAHGTGMGGGAYQSRFFVSNSGGAQWTEVATSGLVHAGAEYVAAHPTLPGVVYVGRFMDLYRSVDGGVTWTNLTNNQADDGSYDPTQSTTHPDHCAMAFAPHDANTLFVGTDGGLYRSRDRGESFTPLNDSLSLAQIYRITADPTSAGRVYAGMQDNGFQRLEGRRSWREMIGGDYGNPLLLGPDRSTILVNYIQGTIVRLNAYGSGFDGDSASNETFGEPEYGRIAFIAPLEAATDGAVFFATWRLFRSDDIGFSWYSPAPNTDLTKGGNDVVSAIGVSGDGNVLYTGSSKGRVMISADRGATWRDATPGLPDRFVTRIVVDPSLPAIAYVSVSGYRTAHVFRTTSGGVSWEPMSSGLPDVPVNALLLDRSDSRVLYAGTDIGVFRYRGTGWEYFGSGMPPVIVTDLDFTAGGTLLAATYGRGVYEYKTSGGGRKRGVRR